MNSDDSVGVVCGLGDLSNGKRRGVGSKNDMAGSMGIELLEDRGFDGEVLEYSFNDEKAFSRQYLILIS